MVTRRRFIQGAAGALLLPDLGFSRGHGGRDGLLVWRGAGQSMRGMSLALPGAAGASWSSCYRSRHYSNVPFTRARFVIPTFYQPSLPLADTDLPYSYTFQLGLEYPFNNSFTGIPNRVAVTFNTANTVTYVSGSGPQGYILSDPVTFPGGYTPGTLSSPNFFGLWTTIENTAGSGSGSNTLPYQANASNYLQRYSGQTAGQSSLIAANTALTATSIGAIGVGVYSSVFSPCMMLIEVDSHYPSILAVGDSILYGDNEGNPALNSYGDSLGSPLGNAGYVGRWVHEVLGHNMVNFARGTDRFSYFSSSAWQYRLPLCTLANPTHIVSQAGINDINGGASSLATVLANAQTFYAALRAAVPGVPIIQGCCTMQSNSTDNWATTANQTPGTGMGGSSSVRGQWNDTYVRTNGSALGNNGFFDVNPVWEYGYTEGTPASETSLWNVTGYTSGGLHPTSYASSVGAQSMVAYRNGSSTMDPFVP